MASLVSFRTARFDVRAETPNPMNPIAGQGVLMWLQLELAKAGYKATEPDPEDWGWYMDVQGAGGTYLVAASGDGEAQRPDVEWVIQIHKRRSLTDRIFGRNRLGADDPLVASIERIARAGDGISDVTVERDA
jgi:hypothetical protein